MASRLRLLPPDVVSHMEECARAAARCNALKCKYNSQGRASEQFDKFNNEASVFMEKANGLLTEEICLHIKYLFYYLSWWAARSATNNLEAAERDRKTVGQYMAKVLDQAELDQELAENIEKMGKSLVLYEVAVTCDDKNSGTDPEESKAMGYKSKIQGNVKFIDMKFFTGIEKAKILERRVKTVLEQTLCNDSDSDQSLTFTFSTMKGSTESVSTTIGCKFTLNASLSVGFSGFGEAGFGACFDVTSNLTLAESLAQTKTQTYTFPVKALPRTSCSAKGTVEEAKMEVPYELILDIGGVQRSFHGTWTGFAVSKANYKVQQL